LIQQRLHSTNGIIFLISFEKWGKLRYALITFDKITKLSRGNGFVCFEKLEDTEKCLSDYEKAESTNTQAGIDLTEIQETKEKKKSILVPSLPVTNSEESSKFMVDNRFVNITPAVSRLIAEKITQTTTLSRRALDKRHLYLMREGVIFPNTPAALNLTPEELDQRVAQFANRKRLLETNPNLFISRTRLSIRGLHQQLTDNHLRHACKQAVRGFWQDVHEKLREPLEPEIIEEEKEQGLKEPSFNRKIWITQSKIIRETDRIDPVTKKAKSKGYGFVEFTSHADAIACLRYMNGNTDLFAKIVEEEFKDVKVNDNGKKLIVEFSVENRLVLKKRDQRNKGASEALGEKSGSEKRKRTDDDKRLQKKVKSEKESEIKDDEKKDKKDKLTFGEKRALRRTKENENYKKEKEKKKETSQKESKESKEPKDFKESKSSNPKTAIRSAIAQKTRNEQSIQKSERERPSKREVKRVKNNQEEDRFQDLVKGFKKKLLAPEVSAKAKSKWYTE
jgi:nucleolar protein 4